jgi:HEAT repeat protein
MDHSVTFARHFARLVWLLLHEPASTDEQKAALRALATVSKDGAVTLTERDHLLAANDAPVSAAFAGVPEVAAQMMAHWVRAIIVDAGASAADLLGVARILASAATGAKGGADTEARRVALGAKTVIFKLRPPPGALPDLELGEMVEEPAPPPSRVQARAVPEKSETARSDAGSAGGGGMFNQFGGAGRPSMPLPALLSQLDQATDAYAVTGVLDDLVAIAESAAREGKGALVGEILWRMTKRETAIQDVDAKRSFAMSLRRLAKPPLMRAVAAQLPHAGERVDELIAVLARAGDEGADAVVEQLASLTAQSDRRAYFDALVKLRAGIATLTHLLGDSRWYVVRNAADLLGEMQAREAEQPLTTLLRHEDDRVRRAATGALMRLGTPRAMQAIQEALRSDAAPMRMQAAAALAARKDVRTVPTLLRALDDEKDEEVQAAFLVALGKLGTPEAVQRLLAAVIPERGLFKKKSSEYRVAGVQGLAEAGTPEAMAGVRGLVLDKDERVREEASHVLRRAHSKL